MEALGAWQCPGDGAVSEDGECEGAGLKWRLREARWLPPGQAASLRQFLWS